MKPYQGRVGTGSALTCANIWLLLKLIPVGVTATPNHGWKCCIATILAPPMLTSGYQSGLYSEQNETKDGSQANLTLPGLNMVRFHQFLLDGYMLTWQQEAMIQSAWQCCAASQKYACQWDSSGWLCPLDSLRKLLKHGNMLATPQAAGMVEHKPNHRLKPPDITSSSITRCSIIFQPGIVILKHKSSVSLVIPIVSLSIPQNIKSHRPKPPRHNATTTRMPRCHCVPRHFGHLKTSVMGEATDQPIPCGCSNAFKCGYESPVLV